MDESSKKEEKVMTPLIAKGYLIVALGLLGMSDHMTDKILDAFDEAIEEYTIYAVASKPISNTNKTKKY